MATQKQTDTARRIVGSVLTRGRIFKAGDEDALAAALPEADVHRLVASGQLAGDWSAAAAPSAPASDETDDDEELTDDEEKEGLPTLAELGDHLAGIDTVEELDALRRTDKRKGAKALYAARRAEIKNVLAAEG